MNDPIVIVRTAPRKRGYLDDTIWSIERAGAHSWPQDRKIIFADNIAVKGHANWTIVHSEKHGPIASGWEALKKAVEFDVPWLLLLEDDIRLCKNAFSFMEKIAVWPDLAWLSFFDKDGEPNLITPHPLGPPRNRHRFWWAQALKISRPTLDHLISKEKLLGLFGPNDFDNALAVICAKYGGPREYGLVCPNVVDHRGAVSSIYARDNRDLVSGSYRGDNFDAMSLLPNP